MSARTYSGALRRQAGAGAALQAEIGRRIRWRLEAAGLPVWRPESDVFWPGHCTPADRVRFETSREVLAELRAELRQAGPPFDCHVIALHRDAGASERRAHHDPC